MQVLLKTFILILSYSVLAVYAPDMAQSAPPLNPKARAAAKKAVAASKSEALQNKYEYIKSHDLNNDGKIDAKDSLIWLKNNKGNYQKALVSTENQDLVQAMDVNGDGNVESWEMQGFYSQYDTNADGVLQDSEIEAASQS